MVELKRVRLFLLSCLVLFVLFSFANFIFVNNSSNIITSQASSVQGEIKFTIVSDAVCGNGICESGETCSNCPADCGVCDDEDDGSGGGGGGTTPSVVYDFSLDKEILMVELVKGEHSQKQIKITNNGTKDILVSVSSLDKFTFLEKESFFIEVGKSEILRVDFYFSEKERADVYVGKINFVYGNLKKSVKVVLDVKDKEPLFDVNVNVLKKYILPGGKVIANVTVLNLGSLKNLDAELEYYILDFENKTYNPKKETFNIKDSFSKIVFLETPKNVSMGDYLFYSKVSYGEISASSYDIFVIEKLSIVMWIMILLILLISIILVLFIIKRKRKKENAS